MEFLIVYLAIGLLIAILVFGICKLEYVGISGWNIAWLTFSFFIGYPIILLGIDIAVIFRILKHKSQTEPQEISNIDNLTEDSSAKI